MEIPSAPVNNTTAEHEVEEEIVDSIQVYSCNHVYPTTDELDGVLVTYHYHKEICPICVMHQTGVVICP